MEYPPTPMMIFMAYTFGHISKDERDYWLRLWNEKHKKEGEDA